MIQRVLSHLCRSFPAPIGAILVAVTACSSSNAPATPPSGLDAGQVSQAPPDAGRIVDATPATDTGLPQLVIDAAANVDSSSTTSDASGDANDANVPPDAASSPYAESCSASSSSCSGGALVCQKFTFGGGAISAYACTQNCTTAADCGPSPAGLQVACDPFTTGGFCVISCDPTSATSCPAPLKCAADQGQATGLCVTL